MDNTIKVVLCVPGYEAQIEEIGNNMISRWHILEGPAEAFRPFYDPDDDRIRNVTIVCNGRGRIDDLYPCRLVKCYDGSYTSVICGTFFICYVPDGSTVLKSLPDDLLEHFRKKFELPEFYVKNGLETVAVPYKPPQSGDGELGEIIRADVAALKRLG